MSVAITIEHIVEVLNRSLEKDAAAVRALFAHRVPCNDALATDPTVQVGCVGASYDVSVLGLINGIAGVDENGWGPICAVYDVVCVDGCHGCNEGLRIGHECPRCGKPLVLGELVRFERTPQFNEPSGSAGDL